MLERIAVAEIPKDERTEVLLKQAADLLFRGVGVEEMGDSPADLIARENYLLMANRQRLLVGVNETGDVIGAATVYKREMTISELSHIAVAPEYRRNHIGARLVSVVEAVATEDGADSLILFPLDDSVPFYLEQGFEFLYDKYGSYMGKTLK